MLPTRHVPDLKLILTMISLVLLAGCYSTVDPPPVAEDLLLADLSDSDYREMCVWSATQEGWPDAMSVECVEPSGSYTRAIMNPELCMMVRLNREEDPECEATVGEWYACQIAIGDDLCQMNLPECIWEGCRDVIH